MPADLLAKVTGLHPRISEPAVRRAHLSCATLPDVDVRALTQRVVGLTLVGKIIEHVLPILTGVGRDGEGALVHTMAAVVGSYAPSKRRQTCSWPKNEPTRPASSTHVGVLANYVR